MGINLRRMFSYSNIISIAPVIIGPIILFIAPLAQGKSFYWGTPVLQFYPWRLLAWEIIKGGNFPLWNSLNGMGSPLLANYQLALFYPPGWLVYVFTAIGGIKWMVYSHGLLVVIHLLFAGLGMSLLGHRLGMGGLARSVCGLSFCLSGYMVARAGFFSMIWTAAWMPWIILAASSISSPYQLTGHDTHRYLGPLVVAITMQLLAGHAQLAWYTQLFAIIWVIVGSWAGGLNKIIVNILKYSIAGFFALLFACVQLIPTFEYLIQSQRASSVGYEFAMTYSLWPWRLLSLIAPDLFGNPGIGNYWGYGNFWEDSLYMGLLPLVLVIGTAFSIIKRNQINKFLPEKRFVLFLLGFLFVSILLALGKNTVIYKFLYQYVPSFDMFQAPSRFLIWFVFCFGLLAGLGISKWPVATGKLLYWLRLLTAGCCAISVGAFIASVAVQGITFSFIRATALVGVWGLGIGVLALTKPREKESVRARIWESTVIVLLLMDLLVSGWRLNPYVSINFFSESKDSLAGRNYISAADEYILKFRKFFRFSTFQNIDDLESLKSTYLPNLNILPHTSTVNNFDPLVPYRYAGWMNRLETASPAIKKELLSLMDVTRTVMINTQMESGVDYLVVPGSKRIRWASCAKYTSDSQEALDLVFSQAHDRVENGMPYLPVLEIRATKGSRNCSENHIDWEIIKDNSNHIIIDVSTVSEGWLVLADTWYPGWKASVDGFPIEIIHGDYLFRAIHVPSGRHIVEFYYRPFSFYLGLLITSLSTLAFFVFSILRKPLGTSIKKI